MRKFLIPAAVLAATLATAAPAAAQWAPQGNAYGYDNRGQGRRLEVRLMQLRRDIAQLHRRDMLSNREAHRLDSEARSLEYRIRQLRQYGISREERYSIDRQIARLQQRIHNQATDGNRRYGENRYGDNRYGDNRYGDNRYNANNGNGYYAYDRDRDGRDDRYEDDRGFDHD
jgi:septal ring factor EnvC (AmiA/AmiB activator)